MENKKKFMWFGLIPIVIIAFDLISKGMIMAMDPKPYMHQVIGNFLRFSFTYNEGITFGMFNNASSSFAPYILSLLQLIAMSVVIYIFIKADTYIKDGAPQTIGRISLMFIVGGALGNFFDRMFLFNNPDIVGHRAVVDFLDVGIGNVRWYTFNVADSFIVVGSIMLAIMFIFFEKKVAKKDDVKEDNEAADNNE